LKIIYSSFFATITIGLIAFAPPLLASTPDGETPAVESVCDDLQGGTPGLYGLCIAYCEAQDLDDIDFTNLENSKKAAPNRKILENYRKKMKPGDTDMPCLAAPCPCWDETELLNVTSENVAGISCVEGDFGSHLLISFDGVDAFAVLGSRSSCRNQNAEFTVTADERASCVGQIKDRCAEIGFPY